MRATLLIVLVFLIFAANASAEISSQKAVNFVSLENQFLFDGEKADIFPNVQLRHLAKKYWVVSVLSGDSVNAFIPLMGNTQPEIPVQDSEKRALIKTAFIVRTYQGLKENLVKQNRWIFTGGTGDDFSSLASQFRNERFDLQTARVALKDYPDIQSGIDGARADIDVLVTALEDAGLGLTAMRDIEAAYFRDPDTNSLDGLKKDFELRVAKTTLAKTLLENYIADLDLVQQAIAQTGLSIEEKTSLQNLLAVPNQPVRVQTITSTAKSAEFFREELQKIFDAGTARRETFLGNLKTRVEKNAAHQQLYGSNADILERTNGTYKSVQEGVADIFLAEKQAYWKEQGEIPVLRESWRKAESYYQNGAYAQAEQEGNAAERSVIRIYKAGFVELTTPEGPDTRLLINGILILVVLLILVYALRNRKKLFSLVAPAEEDDYK